MTNPGAPGRAERPGDAAAGRPAGAGPPAAAGEPSRRARRGAAARAAARAAVRGADSAGRGGHRPAGRNAARRRERARVEDRVDARVSRDVMAAGRVAIPAGSRVIGSVTMVERGGKVKERARLGIRFHTLVLADGTRGAAAHRAGLPRRRIPGGSSSAKKIGGAAIGGAILGAHPRRRQGCGDRRRDRRGRRHRGRDGRRPQRRHAPPGRRSSTCKLVVARDDHRRAARTMTGIG